MRVLVATATAAAVALEEAWRALRPRDTVARADLIQCFPPLHGKVYAVDYIKLFERASDHRAGHNQQRQCAGKS